MECIKLFFNLKYVYSEKATKFCEISTLLLYIQTKGGDFAKYFELLRKYELSLPLIKRNVEYIKFTGILDCKKNYSL